MEPLDVAIVGGGICGLTTALALERHGLSPRVYEAAAEYRPVGAGILLQTNAMLVFDRLGIAADVRAAGVPIDDVRIRSPSGRALKRLDVDGVERAEFEYGYVAIHRASLQRVLLDAIETDVATDMPCTAVERPDAPVARFEDGTTIEPDVLVGADGIDSAVREAVDPSVDRRRLDSVVYRSVIPVDLPEQHAARGVEVWGPGTYTGGAPVDASRFYWFATAPEPLAPESANPATRRSAIREHFSGYPKPIPAILDALEPDDVIRSELADVPTLSRWHRDRVVLAGDAAHALLPFAGQGAAQGIEDAIVLAHALATRDDSTALAAYEAERKPRADRIRTEARRMGSLATIRSSVGVWARNLGFRAIPSSLFDRFRRRRAARTPLPESRAVD